MFRLPCPPEGLGSGHARAWSRRAKKAYFAVLDTMRTGHADPEQTAKLARLIAELAARPVSVTLAHLARVMEAAGRRGESAPLLPPPAEPFDHLVAAADLSAHFGTAADWLTSWPLEWLRTRGYVAGKELQLDWLPELPDDLPRRA